MSVNTPIMRISGFTMLTSAIESAKKRSSCAMKTLNPAPPNSRMERKLTALMRCRCAGSASVASSAADAPTYAMNVPTAATPDASSSAALMRMGLVPYPTDASSENAYPSTIRISTAAALFPSPSGRGLG